MSIIQEVLEEQDYMVSMCRYLRELAEPSQYQTEAIEYIVGELSNAGINFVEVENIVSDCMTYHLAFWPSVC